MHPKVSLIAEGLADIWRAERLLQDVTDVRQLELPCGDKFLEGCSSYKSLTDLRRHARMLFCIALLLANSFAECRDNIPSRSSDPRWSRGAWYPELNILASDLLAKDRKHEISKTRRALDPAERVARLGMIRPRIYPWMGLQDYRRDQQDEREYQAQLEVVSEGLCVLQPSSTFAHTDRSATIGVIATIDMPANQKLFADKASLTALNVSNERCLWCFDLLAKKKGKHVQTPCGRDYCTLSCLSKANRSFHNSDECTSAAPPTHAKLTIRPVDEKENDVESATRRLMSRVLLACVNGYKKHGTSPLQHKLLRHINLDFANGEKMFFSFERDLKEPMLYLEKLGVDIYSNEYFDAWVIMTIWAKLLKSMWAYPDEVYPKVQWVGIGSFYTFFNHSCDPNVICRKRNNSAIIDLTTIKAVKEGEELCISYIDGLSRSERKRRDQLEDWTDECQCTRCKQDRTDAAEQGAAASEDYILTSSDEEIEEEEPSSQKLRQMRIPEYESDDYEPEEPDIQIDAGLTSENDSASSSSSSDGEEIDEQIRRQLAKEMPSSSFAHPLNRPVKIKLKMGKGKPISKGNLTGQKKGKQLHERAHMLKRKIREETDDSEDDLFMRGSVKRHTKRECTVQPVQRGSATPKWVLR